MTHRWKCLVLKSWTMPWTWDFIWWMHCIVGFYFVNALHCGILVALLLSIFIGSLSLAIINGSTWTCIRFHNANITLLISQGDLRSEQKINNIIGKFTKLWSSQRLMQKCRVGLTDSFWFIYNMRYTAVALDFRSWKGILTYVKFMSWRKTLNLHKVRKIKYNLLLHV